jgi:CubicO group peptidase (beta-lactamase class C family)
MKSEPKRVPLQNDICKHVRQKVESFMDATGAPGFAIGLVQGAQVVCVQAHGLESQSGKTPVTVSSNFHMASVSKAFVAVAIVQLALQGKLDLDQPITTYIPEFQLADVRYQQITTRQVLKHRSGMPDVEDYEWDKPKTDPEAALRYLKSLANQTLLSDPGSRFAYSNMAFETLAVLIARVSGMDFETYTQKHVFKPAGMLHSSFLYPAPDVVSQAMPHSIGPDGKAFQRLTYPYNRQHAPSSTLESNINDMNNWMICALGSNGDVLPEQGWQMLWQASPEMLVPERPNYRIGLGWFVQPYHGEQIVGHAGVDDGFITMMLMNPKRRTGVTMMTNTDSFHPDSQALSDLEPLSLEMLDLLSD